MPSDNCSHGPTIVWRGGGTARLNNKLRGANWKVILYELFPIREDHLWAYEVHTDVHMNVDDDFRPLFISAIFVQCETPDQQTVMADFVGKMARIVHTPPLIALALHYEGEKIAMAIACEQCITGCEQCITACS